MSGSLRWRVGAVAAVIALFTFLTVANFVPKEQRVASALLPDDGLRWGLDLQGGFHWVVGVEIAAAVEHELEFQRSNLVDILADEDVVPAPSVQRAAVPRDS